ncbi:MAG: nitrous oxide-stimulated promoter family protein [Spirochaetales bacterium]
MMSKIQKEKNVVAFMINCYCKKIHHQDTLCESCNDLVNYAHKRLNVCPFGEKKTSCLKCKVHCYSKEKRVEIKSNVIYRASNDILDASAIYKAYVQ